MRISRKGAVGDGKIREVYEGKVGKVGEAVERKVGEVTVGSVVQLKRVERYQQVVVAEGF